MKRANSRRTPVIALGILLACCSCAFALNPSLDVTQYAHTAWKVGEGLPSGAIRAIAQTADGYLWLGTEFGLLRFDGVRAVAWQAPLGDGLPSNDIRSLQGARDGRLWIGTFTGLASWKDGKLSHYPELDGQVIEWLLEDREGTIWVAGWAPTVGRLCSIKSGKTQCYGDDGRFGNGVTPLYEDNGGNLWAGAINGLWRWKPGPPTLYPMPDPAERIYALVESDDGGILVAKHTGITKLRNGKSEPYPIPAELEFRPHRLLRDRDGGLWIGAVVDRSLLHIHDGRMDQFTHADGLSDDSVTSLFEDREGNIWVATDNGLDRFREFAVPTISVQQGLSSRGVFSILASREGSIWLGASDGVNRWNKGQITVYHKRSVGPKPRGFAAAIGTDSKRTVREITDSGLPGAGAECLFEDNHGQIWVGTRKGVAIFKSDRFFPVASVPYGIVYSIIADHAGDIWISHEQGLLHLIQTRVVERIPWTKLGRNEPATAVLADSRQDGLWLGFRDGGAAYFKDGEIRASYSGAEGLAAGWVRSFYSDRSGSLWVAAEGGLSRLKDGRVLTLTSQNGLPCNTVQWMMEDDADSVWLYTACGLVRVARSELDAWVSHPTQTIRATVLDTSDGITSHRFTGGFSANVAKSADGKLWFLPVGGVSVLDPHHLAFNKIPPPVHIEQVTADGKNYDVSNGLRLPSGVSDLLFDFTALSFVKPEKVRIRVKLKGQDKTWRELVNQRRVQYTNLPPRAYRFRVLACNDSGVCNEEGDSLDFSIAPAFYQRTSFRVLCVLVFLGALFAAYRLRVRQLAHQFNKTLDVRVSERTRIARDLHDTLLQSFQGLLLKFQSVLNVLPANPDEARQRLNLALDQAAEAITEGRNAVQGLRSSAFESNDLASGIIAIGQELTDDGPTAAPTIDVEVEGAPRDLNPIVRDEAYRIAGEALRNAFRHAQALRITVEIRYDRRQFRLRVRDDGKGIDEATVRRGHAGHFGLHGMRERAEIVGGRLEVWSKHDTGTQVELSIPGAVAYGVQRSWFSRIFSGKSRNKESTLP